MRTSSKICDIRGIITVYYFCSGDLIAIVWLLLLLIFLASINPSNTFELCETFRDGGLVWFILRVLSATVAEISYPKRISTNRKKCSLLTLITNQYPLECYFSQNVWTTNRWNIRLTTRTSTQYLFTKITKRTNNHSTHSLTFCRGASQRCLSSELITSCTSSRSGRLLTRTLDGPASAIFLGRWFTLANELLLLLSYVVSRNTNVFKNFVHWCSPFGVSNVVVLIDRLLLLLRVGTN